MMTPPPRTSLSASRKYTLELVQHAGIKHPSYLHITYLVGINKSKIESWFEGLDCFRSNSDDNLDLRGYPSSFKVLSRDLSSCQSMWHVSRRTKRTSACFSLNSKVMISPSSGIALASQIVEYLCSSVHTGASHQTDRDIPSKRASLKNSLCFHSLCEQVQKLPL